MKQQGHIFVLMRVYTHVDKRTSVLAGIPTPAQALNKQHCYKILVGIHGSLQHMLSLCDAAVLLDAASTGSCIFIGALSAEKACMGPPSATGC